MKRLPHLIPIVVEGLRLTVPAREALERAGNHVTASPNLLDAYDVRYAVEIVSPPAELILCLIGHGAEQHRGLRTVDEPAYPGEWPSEAVAWHERGEWVPCPTCGLALLWCEAGCVPGWRICLGGHASQLSGDGRSAKRHAKQDAATLASTRSL